MKSSLNSVHQTREGNYQKLVELAKRLSKPRGGFRSLGDQLSGHDAEIIAAGVKATKTPAPKTPREGGA